MSASVEVKGLKELADRLGGVASEAVIRRGIDECTKDVLALTAIYPPEGEGNKPKDKGKWWQRHKGWRWKTKDGIHGRDTSEKLQKSWKRETAQGMTGRVYSEASYAKYVQGDDQTDWHQAAGWKTVKQIAEEYAPKAAARMTEHIARALAQ